MNPEALRALRVSLSLAEQAVGNGPRPAMWQWTSPGAAAAAPVLMQPSLTPLGSAGAPVFPCAQGAASASMPGFACMTDCGDYGVATCPTGQRPAAVGEAYSSGAGTEGRRRRRRSSPSREHTRRRQRPAGDHRERRAPRRSRSRRGRSTTRTGTDRRTLAESNMIPRPPPMPQSTSRRLPRPPSPPSASGPPTRDEATPARRGGDGSGSLDLRVLSDTRVRPRMARPGTPLVAFPPAGLFIGGLPRELTADLLRHITQTVGQQSPSFQALRGVTVRRLPGSRRNRAVFLAHPAFAEAGPVQSVWRELTQRLQHTENQCTLPTPSGPVRLEVARRNTPSPRHSEASPPGDRNQRDAAAEAGPAAWAGAARPEGSHAPPVSADAATGDASTADAVAAEAAGAELAAAAPVPEEVVVGVASGPPRTGTDPLARSAAPPEELCCTFVQAANCLPTDCTICAQPMSPGDTLQRLPCLHVFHATCASRWWGTEAAEPSGRARCPFCNVDIRSFT